MLDQQTIHNALEFLGRVTLVGNEVPAFVQVTNALQEERIRLAEQARAGTERSPALNTPTEE